MSEWISWAEASTLTGIRTPTIEHAVRVGRIQRRPRQGMRPSLQRESVLAWAAWYLEQKANPPRRSRSPAETRRQLVRTPSAAPARGDWVSVQEAAARLEVCEDTVRRLGRAGQVKTHRAGGRVWVDDDSVATYAAEEARWCTFLGAADLIGCSRHDVEKLCRAGELAQRHAARARPSVLRESAEAVASVWATRLENRERMREEAARAQHRRRPAHAPPDDAHVWVSTAVTARLLGVSASAIGQSARRGTIPSVLKGHKRWFRRADVEVVAASRDFKSQAERAGSS